MIRSLRDPDLSCCSCISAGSDRYFGPSRVRVGLRQCLGLELGFGPPWQTPSLTRCA